MSLKEARRRRDVCGCATGTGLVTLPLGRRRAVSTRTALDASAPSTTFTLSVGLYLPAASSRTRELKLARTISSVGSGLMAPNHASLFLTAVSYGFSFFWEGQFCFQR